MAAIASKATRHFDLQNGPSGCLCVILETLQGSDGAAYGEAYDDTNRTSMSYCSSALYTAAVNNITTAARLMITAWGDE